MRRVCFVLVLTLPSLGEIDPYAGKLPDHKVCRDVSWAEWRQHEAWLRAANDACDDRDFEEMYRVSQYLHDSSWAWWHAADMSSVNRGDAAREDSRRRLRELIGEQCYRGGVLPPPMTGVPK